MKPGKNLKMEKIRNRETSLELLQKNIKITNMFFRFRAFRLTNLLAFTLAVLLTCLLVTSGCGGSGGGSGSSSSSTVGSATLTWTSPTTKADGQPLTNLAGYKIYYGTSSGNYAVSIDVGCAPCPSSCSNPTVPIACSHTVHDLVGGHTYYFTVSAYNTAESGYADPPVSKTID